MAVAGADAAKIGRDRGWAVVTIGDDGGVSVAFEPVLQPITATVELLAIDVPIGLPGDDPPIPLTDSGARLADAEARQLVGVRRSSVFVAPPFAAIAQSSYQEARARFPSVPSQAYHLRDRIVEARQLASAMDAVVETRALLGVVDRDLHDSEVAALSPDTQLGLAYNAALQAGTIALAAHGYRASRERKHHRTIQSLALTIGANPATVRKLDAFRKKRNIGDYERAGSTSAKEASELRDLARQLQAAVRGWLETPPSRTALTGAPRGGVRAPSPTWPAYPRHDRSERL